MIGDRPMNETRKAYHVELDDLRSDMIKLGAADFVSKPCSTRRACGSKTGLWRCPARA